ncbi:MAG: Ornithine carbamoyltransferase [Actinomycetota bacterium]
MTIDLRGRDFLKEIDFTSEEFLALIDLAAKLKVAGRNREKHLDRMKLALVFEKTSTRTRAAFEVAAFNQGANVTFIDPTASQIGHKESIADSARVLCRFYDGIEYRGHAQAIVERLAMFSEVPVFNGLTDEWHPTQMLADFLTMFEHGKSRKPVFAYLGDARNNVANSLLVTGALLGCDVRIAAPVSLQPAADVVKIANELAANSRAKITITDDVAVAVKGAEFIHTDVWVSMGEPIEKWDERINLLKPYQVNDSVFALTENADTKFMHCLPAYHDTETKVGADVAARFKMTDGIEVTNSVFESERNIAFDQAENRLHTIEAILVATLGNKTVTELLG